MLEFDTYIECSHSGDTHCVLHMLEVQRHCSARQELVLALPWSAWIDTRHVILNQYCKQAEQCFMFIDHEWPRSTWHMWA